MSIPTTALAHELIRMACSAPSVHNTQPWAWRLSPDAATIDLHADRSRQLPGTDPSGRDLTISCGAAIHHLQVAAPAFGLRTDTTLLPDRNDHDLLGRIRLAEGHTTEEAVAQLAGLEDRTTDRRGFTDWEIPVSRLEHLAEVASGFGVQVLVLSDPQDLARTETLIERARTIQLAEAAVGDELYEWTGRRGPDGIPPANAEPIKRLGIEPRLDRFSRRRPRPEDADHSERPDALLVICTGADSPRAWLRSGHALSKLWIRATLDGIGLTPQSQVIEVPSTRSQLRREVFDDIGRPQLVVRVGWQESSRPVLDRTPRRALEDVLLS